MKHLLEKEKRDKITQDIVAIISKNCSGLVAIYLFGTFNTEQPFADIDIGILFEKNVEDALNKELVLEAELEKQVRYSVDVRILNDAPISFSHNVISNGCVILDRNPNNRADFETLRLKKYFDFKYFRKRYLMDVSNAPL